MWGFFHFSTGFKQNKVPDNLDAIVIGSGAGGLTAAILLAKAGKRVVVVEQHDQAGGCCHTFEEKGFEFDTGLHLLATWLDMHVNRLYQRHECFFADRCHWIVVVCMSVFNLRQMCMSSTRYPYRNNLFLIRIQLSFVHTFYWIRSSCKMITSIM